MRALAIPVIVSKQNSILFLGTRIVLHFLEDFPIASSGARTGTDDRGIQIMPG